VVVTGGTHPLADLGVADDPALVPFAGRHRLIDLALSTLLNSRLDAVHVAAPHASPMLRAQLQAAAPGRRELRRVLAVARPRIGRAGGGRLGRLLAAYRAVYDPDAEVVVAVLADHVLQLDLRDAVGTHCVSGADVTLLSVTRPVSTPGAGPFLRLSPNGVVGGVTDTPEHPTAGLAVAWGGDMLVSPRALPALEAACGAHPHKEARALDQLAVTLRVRTHDVLEPGPAGAPAFFHEPASVEEYYEAQMAMCTPRPPLDLHDPAWPLLTPPGGLGPARVVADTAGRTGQVLNTLVADGAVVRGGVTINTILGHDVMVDSGAEVEDSILFDGCRIGRHARVRRALVGPGAVVGDGEMVGYDAAPPPLACVRPSGLTLIPAPAPAVAIGAR
jgi:glucose-1-phosphate adenylyltransferase